MRPKITGQLKKQVEQIHEQAGYATPSELVRDAVRRRIEELQKQEDVQINDTAGLFDYEIRSNPVEETIKLDLKPKQNTGIRLKYQKKPAGNHVELKTESKKFREFQISDKFDDIDGITEAGFITKPRIRFKINKETERPFSVIVDEIFNRLYEMIGIGAPEEINRQQQEQLEAAVQRHADPL